MTKTRARRAGWLAELALTVLVALPAAASADWTTYRGDAARSGVDTSSTGSVPFASAWTSSNLGGDIWGQPLVHDGLVIVATESDEVGSSVSPALFIAGFSLRSVQIQRVFALVELLRAVAAFLAAALLLHFAMTVALTPPAGTQDAIWVCFGVAAGGGLLALYILVLGRARLQRPDLDRFEQGEGPAWESPPLLAGIRGECDRPERRPWEPAGGPNPL